MKVLQINTVYRNGGSTGRIAYELKCLCEDCGIQGYAAYGYEFSPLSEKERVSAYRMCTIPQMQWSKIKTRLFAHHGFYNYNETKRLLDWIDGIKPDIIHLHNLHNHYMHIGLLFEYIKKNNIPVVWTLHDCWSFTGWCSHFDFAKCDKWKTGCHDCKLRHEYPYSWFIDNSKQNYKDKLRTFTGVENLTIVTPSEWLANLVRQSYLKDYPVRVINNGINLNVFRPTTANVREKYGIKGNHIILALFNAFGKNKGTDYLIKMCDYLTDEEELVIVGIKKDKDFAKLPKHHCVGIKHTDSVQELAAIYSLADVFVNPTLQDTFPTTNLEALACGTPVVTFRTGGSVESVDDSTGIIVDQCDLKGMLKAVRSIIRQGKDTYSIHCVEKAQKLYNKDERFMEYIDLYKKILEI